MSSLGVSAAELALCGVAAVIGAVVQGSIGFGYALVLVPTLLLLAAPAAIPVTPLTVAAPMVLVQAFAERRALDTPGFARMTAGRVPGTVLGAWLRPSVLTFAAVAGMFALVRGLA